MAHFMEIICAVNYVIDTEKYLYKMSLEKIIFHGDFCAYTDTAQDVYNDTRKRFVGCFLLMISVGVYWI